MVSFTSYALLAISQLAAALPGSPAPLPFQVTNLNSFEPAGRVQTDVYRVGFNVTDPNEPPAATYCEARWNYFFPNGTYDGKGWPHNFLANCTEPSWAFKFADYANYMDFALNVKHTCRNRGKGVTRFANGKVDLDILQCSHAASGFSVCNQKTGVAFSLAVHDIKRS